MTRYDQYEHGALTDVGVRRSHNQDNLAILEVSDEEAWQKTGHVFLVADGMGGHAVGEKASEQAVGIIPHTYHKYAWEGPPVALRKAFLEANATIHACGEQNHEFRGMGTTSTGLVLRGNVAWLAHVGDSRAYRIRDGVIEQLTYDHSYVWEYARRNGIDPDKVQDFPTNVIHRCLGPQPFVEVDIEGPHELEDGDIFLMCSDGLSGQVTDHEIGVLASVLPPKEACRFLVDLANMRGGPDNITVVIIRIGPGEAGENVPTTPRKLPTDSLLARLPWPLGSLVGGILLAATAILAKVADVSSGLALILFLLAIIPIAVGVAGLVLQQRRQQMLQAQEGRYVPRTYRQARCHVDKAFVDKLVHTAKVLRERLEQQNIEADLAAFEYHHKLADELLQSEDLPGAFREMCRAIQPLNNAWQGNLHKEESFQPVWDKSHG